MYNETVFLLEEFYSGWQVYDCVLDKHTVFLLNLFYYI
jgi:hypothetical protein